MFKFFIVSKLVNFEIVDNAFTVKYKFIINPLKNFIFKLIFLTETNISMFFIDLTSLFFKNLSFFFIKSFVKLITLHYNVKFYSFKIFKAYGINMRVIRLFKKKKKNILFLRLGFSHGFLLKLSNFIFFRVFKRRYFLIVGNDLNYINNISYQLRSLRSFFQYKLIGIKSIRDWFKIKIGKKKTF